VVNPVWREELHAALVRQHLPPAYVARLMDELCDHYDDLFEESHGMDAVPPGWVADRIGAPDQLAVNAATIYRQRTFSGRHPVVTFAALPFGLVLASWAGLMVVHGVVGTLLEDWGWSLTLPPMADEIATVELLLPILVIAAVFARLAGHRGLDWRWPLLTTAVLALLSGVFYFQSGLSAETQRPVFSLIMGLPFTGQQWLQTAVMGAIGTAFCWRARQRRPLAASQTATS
jgi:hypothetical protein